MSMRLSSSGNRRTAASGSTLAHAQVLGGRQGLEDGAPFRDERHAPLGPLVQRRGVGAPPT